MMSLGVRKGGVITPSAEDRKKIITQMKVRTTLKGDKSWIHPQTSDNEEEKRSSPLHSPCMSVKIDGGSPASASATPESTRLPSSKPTSGYLIRGVFTRTIDKTPSESTSYSNGTQKSASTQAKSASLPHYSSGYKMTTKDYKKLAPFNVKPPSVDSDEGEPSFSPDEHRKRTEAANSVLRRTASKERSYVLSAAKKSNGSPTQEVPPFFAKRVEIEEEDRPRRRSQTLPASSSNGVRKSPTGSSWREPKPMAAVSTTSLDANNKSQATRSWSENTSRISTFTESSDKLAEEEPARTSPGETRTSKPTLAMDRSDKPVEEPDLISWDESIPKATTISPRESEKKEARVPEDSRGPVSSEESHETRKQNIELDQISEGPLIVISPETSHNGANLHHTHTDSPVNTTPEIHLRYRVSECLDEMNFELPRPSSQSGDMPTHPTTARFKAPTYLDDAESEPKRAVPDSEGRSTVRETRHEVTEQKEPEQNVASPSSEDRNTVDQGVRYKVPVHLDDDDFYINRSVSGHEERRSTRESRNENHRATEHNELDLSMTNGHSSYSKENTVITQESRSSDSLHVDDAEFDQDRIAPGYEERISITREMNYESPQTRRHNKPDLTTAKESTVSVTETSQVIPSNLNRQQITTTMPELSHKMPSYLDNQTLDNQTYNTRRPVPAYEERSSPRNTRYESLGTSGHSEFDPSMGRHYTHSRDSSTVAMTQESHNKPCYMDGSESDTRRLPSASGERISISAASSQYSSPSAMEHESSPNTSSKGILFVKEYVNSRELSPTPRYSSGSLVDLSDLDRASYSNTSYLHSSAPQRSSEGVCTYCGREIRDCPKIMIEHLSVYCHEYCFRCGICHKAMGDLLDKIFIHRDIVHCDQCYEKLF